MESPNKGLPFDILSSELLDDLAKRSLLTERKRMNYNFHESSDLVQRMLNIMCTGTYVRPHRHLSCMKNELFLCLRGKIAILIFNDSGAVTNVVYLDEQYNRAIDIKPSTWHSIIVMENPSICLEAKTGPYLKELDKDWGEWAPEEGSDSSATYLKEMENIVAKGQRL